MGSALANLAYGMFPLTPDQKRICKKNVTFAQSHYSSTAIRFLLEAAGCSFQRREVMTRNLYRFYLYTVFMVIRSLTTYWQMRSLARKLPSPFAAYRTQSHHKYKQADSTVTRAREEGALISQAKPGSSNYSLRCDAAGNGDGGGGSSHSREDGSE